MTATNGTNKPELRKRVEKIRSLPSSPAVLQPLLDLLRKPPEQIHIEQVVKLVSYEKTITAQLLRIANSPLYGRAVPAESIQAAVATLGIQRIEDILLSNCFNSMVPRESWVVDPGVFWRHSFGCALVCQEFAEQVDFPDSGKAYLAGLLHDLGIIVNSLAYTDEYRLVIARAAASGRPLEEQEQETMGFTHCDSGAILAQTWQLPKAIEEVVQWHHHIDCAPGDNPLVGMVHICDLLCRMRGLGYGYEEWRLVDLETDAAWIQLGQCCPKIATMDLARFTMDLDAHVVRVSKLVDTIFAPAN